MRITFVLPHASLNGGVRVVAIYAERLKRRGHEVTVVSTPPSTIPFRRKLKSFLKGKGWPADYNPTHSYFDHLDITHHVIDRFRPMTDNDVPDADVVIATWWETAEWVSRLSPSKGAKAFFLQHYEDICGPEYSDRVAATWRLPLHKITISRWLVDLAANRFNDRNVSLILNSVDMELFNAPPRGRRTVPTVGLLYSRTHFKGVPVALKAFEIARKHFPSLKLVAFGDHTPNEELPLPKGSIFTLQPPQKSIKDIYAGCDVWLCGSYAEGFHLPPLEAMACRCPVVSTRVGGPVDIIVDGQNGYLCDIGDAETLAQNLITVLSLEESRWKLMSDAAYATATQYTWDDAATLFESALEYTLERAARGEIAGGLSPNITATTSASR